VTCIVGIECKGKVYIGGDSAGVSGQSLSIRADTKVFKRGPYVFGFTSSFRMGQILRYCGELPRPKGSNLEKFMCTTFVSALIKNFEKYRFGSTEGAGAFEAGNFLVGVKGVLFNVESDLQVGRTLARYDAVGCGAEIAKGALYATKQWSDPVKRILTALEASEACSTDVSRPFHVLYC